MLAAGLCAVQIAYIDKQLLVAASEPGCRVDVFRHASVLLASTHQQRLAAATGLEVRQEAYRCGRSPLLPSHVAMWQYKEGRPVPALL